MMETKPTAEPVALKTHDNNRGKPLEDMGLMGPDSDTQQTLADLQTISGVSPAELAKEHESLLVFPQSDHNFEDESDQSAIFTLGQDKVTTHNILGFVGINETQLTITSRFYPNDNDFFLYYMLHKVFALNLVDLKHRTDSHQIRDLLVLLFPHLLKQAVRQGMYKEYHRWRRNDWNVRGPVDVARHLRANTPFRGSIAYTVREHSLDNAVTQLVRQTIEHLHTHAYGTHVLAADTETVTAVRSIVGATSSYRRNQLPKIIAKNSKPVRHPYFTAYEPLRRICLQILRNEMLNYGDRTDKVYGLVFDGSWLWEEYLNTILRHHSFVHPKPRSLRKTAENPTPLFIDSNAHKRYPDFYAMNRSVVADAKYKRLESLQDGRSRDDLHQIVTYMYILRSRVGLLLYPTSTGGNSARSVVQKIGTLNGYGCVDPTLPSTVSTIAFPVPTGHDDFTEFADEMSQRERDFAQTISGFKQIHVH